MQIKAWIENNPNEFRSWLAGQRWFGDKSRLISRISTSVIDEFEIVGEAYGLMQVAVDFEDGGHSTYFAPMREHVDGQPGDALDDSAFLTWIGDGFPEGRVRSSSFGGGVSLAWTTVEGGKRSSWPTEPAHVMDGEQSNSSISYGTSAIAKIFRKLQPGINPDSEIVSFLTRQGEFHNVPAFLGSIQLMYDDGQDGIELAAVQEFVANQGDSWRWLPSALANGDDSELQNLLAPIALLGQRSGELHCALAEGVGDEAFAPIPYAQSDVDSLEHRLGREVRLTTAMLHRQGACSYVESEDLASSLLRSVSHARALIDSLQTRVHGDYHLGQVLRVDEDFVIIDFEGEPSRSMSERRQRYSPLKDVAGMLRSIDYAVASAIQSTEPDRQGVLAQWRSNAEQAFLEGYLQAISRTDLPLVPTHSERFQRALDVFMIEKALYEVRYELDNRPDWIDIPFGALQRIGAST